MRTGWLHINPVSSLPGEEEDIVALFYMTSRSRHEQGKDTQRIRDVKWPKLGKKGRLTARHAALSRTGRGYAPAFWPTPRSR
jgi:hypothetical protein